MAYEKGHTQPSAPDLSWTATLRTHTETRQRDRKARLSEAVVYFHQITNTSPDSADFSKPLTLGDLVTSINTQERQYHAFRDQVAEQLPYDHKKTHRLWGSKRAEDRGLSRVDETPAESRTRPSGESARGSGGAGSTSFKRSLMDVVKATFGPVELIGKMTIDTFGQSYPGVAYAFGSVFFLIKTARGVSELYDSIQEFFGLIKPFLDRLAVYSQGELSSELEDIITDVLIAIIRINGVAASIISHNRATQFFRVILGKDERIKRELAALRELFDNESRMVSAILLREFQAKLARPAPSLEQKSMPQHDVAARLAACKANLSPITAKGAPDNVLRSTEAKMAEGTGTWLFSEPAFKAWQGHQSTVLWVSGGPGVGKTFLSCQIVRKLLESVRPTESRVSCRSVLYFFCKSDVRDLRSVGTALRTLSYQMCAVNPLYADHVDSHCPQSTELDVDTLWIKLFQDYFRPPPELPDYSTTEADFAYIVLDGLDELDLKERRALLKILNRFLRATRKSSTKPHMQFVFVGRPELTPEVESHFRSDLLSITITPQKNTTDIERHVTESIDDGRLSDIDVPDRHREAFIRMLSQRAGGMFLWADLMIDEISMKDDFRAMQRALEKAPGELSGKILDSLEQMGKTLDEEQTADLNEMLAWVTCAQRRLTLAELKLILAAKQQGRQQSLGGDEYAEEMIQFESSLRKRYSSWFTLIRDDGLSTEDLRDFLTERHSADLFPKNDFRKSSTPSGENSALILTVAKKRVISSPSTEVILAHSSIKEHFEREAKTSSVGVDIDKAHASIVLFLLDMICNTSRARGTLYPYACNQWQSHLILASLDKVENTIKSRIGAFLVKLFHDRLICRRWIAQVQPFWSSWILNEENQRHVREWLADPAFTAALSQSEQAWAREVHEEVGLLVRLPYDICTAEWLKHYDWIAPACFENVAAYMAMTHCLANGLEWPASPMNQDQRHAMHVRKVAQWTGLEKDAIWHSRLGFCLRQLSYPQDAILEHEAALMEDPNCLPSKAGLAYCFEDMDDLVTAVEHMSEVLDRLEDDSNEWPIPKMTVEIYYNSMGEWQAKLDNQDAAIAAWEKLREQTRPSAVAHTNLLNALYAQGKYAELVKVLENLSSDSMPGQKHSTLTQLCLQWYTAGEEQLPYCPGIEHAALQLGKIDIIRDMYVSAIEATESMGDVTWGLLLKIDLAQLLYRCYEADDEAIAMWRGIAHSRHGKPGTFLRLPQAIASQRLQDAYAHQAATSQNPTQLTQCIKDFEDLIELDRPDSDRSVHRNPDDDDPVDFAMLRLGSLYMMQDRKADAMEALKTNLELGLDLLEQRRSLEGFECLLRVFVSCKDDTHALAAFSRLSSDALAPFELETYPEDEPLDAGATVIVANNMGRPDGDAGEVAEGEALTSAAATPLDELALKLSRVCDGCGFEAPRPNGFFHCRVCTDMDWCADCMSKLQEGALQMFPPRKCDRQHGFLQIPNWKDKLDKGKIRVDAEQWDLNRWIDRVKKEWKLL